MRRRLPRAARVPPPAMAALLGAMACRAPRSQSGTEPSAAPDVAPSFDAVHAPPLPSATDDGASSFVPRRVTGEGHAMGTHLAFAAFTTERVDEAAARAAFDAAIAEIVRLEGLMTTWRPDTELSRVNAAAGREPVEISLETMRVVEEALRASAFSDGAFDITFETLHGLWKFDQDLDPHPPTDAQIQARLPDVGYRHVHLDATRHTLFLDRPGTRVSLGGIAKGYAVDRAGEVLRQAGLTSFYVQAGGDLYAAGTKSDGAPWSAGIRDPRGPEGAYFAVLPVRDHAFSTAGDYERSYVIGGRRYHHILDPRTGRPASASRSVTIWAKTALEADAIDDAVFVLGPARGLALCESLDGVGCVIVDAKNEVHVSKRLQGRVKILGAPTDAP